MALDMHSFLTYDTTRAMWHTHVSPKNFVRARGGGGGLDPESPTVNEGAPTSGSSSGNFSGGSSGVLARGGRI